MLVFEFPLHKTSIRGTLAILAIRDLFKLYRGRGTRQVNRPAEQPWFDQPNVMKLLEQRRRGAEKFAYKEFEDLQHWHHYWDT